MIKTSFSSEEKELSYNKTNEGIQELLKSFDIKETFQELLTLEIEKKLDHLETNTTDEHLEIDILSVLDNNSKGIKFSKIFGNDANNEKVVKKLDELQSNLNNNIIDTSLLNKNQIQQLEKSLGMR